MQHQATQQYQQQYQKHYTNRQEYQGGSGRKSKSPEALKVDFVPPKDKEARAADKAGDFVDFEEIK